MPRSLDVLLTALAPTVWGSTYLVTTELLPDGYPLTAAMLRALPAGLILLAVTRMLPRGVWLRRAFVLGALNFSIFWWLLFVAAYALPGGVAATVGAIQPLIVLWLAKLLLEQRIRPAAVLAGISGIGGVALLVLTPRAALDPIGILAALGGAVSMAFGTVLTRKWQPPVSALTFTAWQLTAGGLLLLPAALLAEPALPPLTLGPILGFIWLGLIGGAVTYFLWFRGIARLGPSAVAPLALLSPAAAVLLGWVVLEQSLSLTQTLGMVLVLVSIWFGQRAQRDAARSGETTTRAPRRLLTSVCVGQVDDSRGTRRATGHAAVIEKRLTHPARAGRAENALTEEVNVATAVIAADVGEAGEDTGTRVDRVSAAAIDEACERTVVGSSPAVR